MARRVITKVTADDTAPQSLGKGGNCDIYNSGSVTALIGSQAELLAGGGRPLPANSTYPDRSGVTDVWCVLSTGADTVVSSVAYNA